MILFTSDLDRTLIFSKTMMSTYPAPGGEPPVPVERKGDEIITYMSKQSIDLLKKIHQLHLFVPVTTRAFYQYERIHLFQNEITPKYAICNNGGTILIDGKKDEEWDRIIRERLDSTAVPNADILKAFAEIRHDEWVKREFCVDDFFYMFHVDKEKVPRGELEDFEKELRKLGWNLFLHGRKLYILPISLDKAFAVTQLKKNLDYDLHIAAGDSLMDYSMISDADIGYSPIHGELFEAKGNTDTIENQPNPADNHGITWIGKNGAASAEQLLNLIVNQSGKEWIPNVQ